MPHDQQGRDAQQSYSMENTPDPDVEQAEKNDREPHRPSAAQAEENRENDPPA